jgi:hypothetical protein
MRVGNHGINESRFFNSLLYIVIMGALGEALPGSIRVCLFFDLGQGR